MPAGIFPALHAANLQKRVARGCRSKLHSCDMPVCRGDHLGIKLLPIRRITNSGKCCVHEILAHLSRQLQRGEKMTHFNFLQYFCRKRKFYGLWRNLLTSCSILFTKDHLRGGGNYAESADIGGARTLCGGGQSAQQCHVTLCAGTAWQRCRCRGRSQ